MGLLLLAAFIGVPLLEIAVFIVVGDALGLWPTLVLVILTAIIGSWQLRAQGLAALASARVQIERGALPTRELFDGACLLGAGALLLTPGFVTDTIGFLLFLPPLRAFLRRFLARRLTASVHGRTFTDQPEAAAAAGQGPIIDGEFQEIHEADNENQAAVETPVIDLKPKGPSL